MPRPQPLEIELEPEEFEGDDKNLPVKNTFIHLPVSSPVGRREAPKTTPAWMAPKMTFTRSQTQPYSATHMVSAAHPGCQVLSTKSPTGADTFFPPTSSMNTICLAELLPVPKSGYPVKPESPVLVSSPQTRIYSPGPASYMGQNLSPQANSVNIHNQTTWTMIKPNTAARPSPPMGPKAPPQMKSAAPDAYVIAYLRNQACGGFYPH